MIGDASTLAMLAVAVPLLAMVGGLVLRFVRPPRVQDYLNVVSAAVTACGAFVVAADSMFVGTPAAAGTWVAVDPIAGPFLAVTAVVGLGSALVSPAYLNTSHRSFFRPRHARGWYYLCLHFFWAALLAIPIMGNLGVAWVLVEATTGVSALLVAYSGRRSALEAGWKYLVLTTIGLTVALLGIVVLYSASVAAGGDGLRALSWAWLSSAVDLLPHQAVVTGFLLLVAGLATKVGWAPVHNWLPDAHSEAPPPISALLSAALLPAVMAVAWRAQIVLLPAAASATGRVVFQMFGIVSLAVAVPFLWRPLAWKRLLAYSSLEHMGVLALGIGFAHPVATAGFVLHVAGHALAKSLGFWAAIPLFQVRPSARTQPVRGLLHAESGLAATMSLSLGSLAGLPPSPLFFSEVLVLMGGFMGGHTASAAIAALLLSLGFLGLAQVLVEGLLARGRGPRPEPVVGLREIKMLGIAAAILLGLMALATPLLPGSSLVNSLTAVLP